MHKINGNNELVLLTINALRQTVFLEFVDEDKQGYHQIAFLFVQIPRKKDNR